MTFKGKGSVFTKSGLVQVKGIHPADARDDLLKAILKAILKATGTRAVIGEEAFAAAASAGKGVHVKFESGKDQNYLIVTLE